MGRGDIQKAIAFINELRCENKSAGSNSIDGTGNFKILERRLEDRSKSTTSFLIPSIDFFIEEHTTLLEKSHQENNRNKNQFG